VGGWPIFASIVSHSPRAAQQDIRHGGSIPSIVIAQGGGPTAVINQTLCGVILAPRGHDPSLRVLRARYGGRGLTAGNVAALTGLAAIARRCPAYNLHAGKAVLGCPV